MRLDFLSQLLKKKMRPIRGNLRYQSVTNFKQKNSIAMQEKDLCTGNKLKHVQRSWLVSIIYTFGSYIC